ncbi:TadE/TadG family type IV pilus assembly protein [Methylobacterium nigriterrae]|uniref:TadE/TadG family type IV pilus assembly protein n=1 Tax=Methylobacterium nigriterrae TaxID=3127512 RepID=UPI00301341FB
MRRLRPPRILACERGAVAVEMALLAWPMIGLVVGILQLVIVQYTQVQLSNALYDSASSPEAELILGSATAYKAKVCGKIIIMPSATCNARLLVELMKLSDAPTAATAVAGTTFDPGSANDALLLRASVPTLQFLPLLPSITARASVVFRR